MIALRKHHPAYRMASTVMIQEHLKFMDNNDPLLLAYAIIDHANGDEWKDILVILNGDKTEKEIGLPEGQWTVAMDGNTINEAGIKQVDTKMIVPAISAMVLYRK